MAELIFEADDMNWLREVHLHALPKKYKSALVFGNMDYPDRIEVFVAKAPVVTDVAVVYLPDEDGKFQIEHLPRASLGGTGMGCPPCPVAPGMGGEADDDYAEERRSHLQDMQRSRAHRPANPQPTQPTFTDTRALLKHVVGRYGYVLYHETKGEGALYWQHPSGSGDAIQALAVGDGVYEVSGGHIPFFYVDAQSDQGLSDTLARLHGSGTGMGVRRKGVTAVTRVPTNMYQRFLRQWGGTTSSRIRGGEWVVTNYYLQLRDGGSVAIEHLGAAEGEHPPVWRITTYGPGNTEEGAAQSANLADMYQLVKQAVQAHGVDKP